MLQHPDNLPWSIAILAEAGEYPRQLLRVQRSVRSSRADSALAGLDDHVVHERCPVAAPHGLCVVQAVRVERRECKLTRLVDAKVDGGFAILVPDDQLAALAIHRKRDDQGCNHPVCLLCVAVVGEESSRLVDQELVGFQIDTALRQSQALSHFLEDRAERSPPARPAEFQFRCVDLPAVPNCRVNQGFRATPVRGLLGNLDKRADLEVQNRESNPANLAHVHPRRQGVDPSLCKVVAAAVD